MHATRTLERLARATSSHEKSKCRPGEAVALRWGIPRRPSGAGRGLGWVVGPRSHKYRLRSHCLPRVLPRLRVRLRLRLRAILAQGGQRGVGLGGEVHG
jgi:hypothetical protein